ncbi:MAG: S8 family serine peptidase [Candidatus Methanoperedens sp.]
MKISKIITFGALLVAAMLIAIALVSPMGANPDVKQMKSEKALDYISQKHGVPKEKLMITNEKDAKFPLTNQKIWSVKILDPQTRKSYYIDLDEAGNIADIKAAKALERIYYKEKYGKKEIELHEKLQKMNPDDMVEVGIWLSPLKDTPRPEIDFSENEYNEMRDAKRRDNEQKEKLVIDILKTKNINIRYASQYAPLIYAQIPSKKMPEIENIPEIEGIYLAREFKPLLNVVAQTERVQSVWNAGITGNGIKVAVVEQNGIKFPHPNLTYGSYYNSSGVVGSHATGVAGIIATNNNTTYKGISYGVPGLLSANAGSWNEADLIAASDWAISNGANILSNSWGIDTHGVLSGIDKYYDNIVWNYYINVIVAAGNNYEGEDWRVLSPGLGYNVITVGGFDDKNTASWSDDTMWANSAYVDPVSQHNDREKPEVSAVASHGNIDIISSRSFPPWIGDVGNGGGTGSGTSYAAPAVAGEAALIIQTNVTPLRSWVFLIRALIMVSADHNIEGAGKLSEKDGAGGIDISKAYETVTNNRYVRDLLVVPIMPKVHTFSATQGQKVRVAISWASHPDTNNPPANDDLKADLDMFVYTPSGALVDYSNSYDNSYEIVEFTAPETGTYTATISAYRFEGYKEYMGFAYAYV